MLKFTDVNDVWMGAAMASPPSAVGMERGSSPGTSRAKKSSESARTSGSAFSWMGRDAGVWRRNNVQRPLVTPLSETGLATWAVSPGSAWRR